MLTTVDNPFNPFTQYDEWSAYDEQAGYHTNGLLARMIKTSSDLSEADESLAIEQAIDDVIELNPLGVHRKVASSDVPISV